PVEKVDHVLHHAAVVLHGLPPDARPATATDVVVEARPLTLLGGQVVGTAAHGIEAADDGERASELPDISVRPVVAGAGDIAPAGDEHARKRIGERHGDGRITLIVLEPDVEAG